MECCVCLKDYLNITKRIQNETSQEVEMDNIDTKIEKLESSQNISTPPTIDTDNLMPVEEDDDEKVEEKDG